MSRTTICLAVVAVLAALPGSALAAATDDTSVAITGGTLDYTTPLAAGDFPATTLSGVQQTRTATVAPYVVTDARGGSEGWNLTVAASQFTSGTNTLPAGSLAMAAPPVPTTTAGNLGVAPVPQAIASPIDGGTTQKMVSAAAVPLGGAGEWTFTPLAGTLTLTIPPAVAAGTYSSTITTTLATGP